MQTGLSTMKLYKKQFLGIEGVFTNYEKSAVAILPFPYEGGISYGRGTFQAPDAIIDASFFLEEYDEVLEAEPYRIGIATVEPPDTGKTHQEMFHSIYSNTHRLIEDGKFVVVIGGDHSISTGLFQALKEKYTDLGVIQLDAHADLRDSYEESPLNHACVMSRIREMSPDTLHIGIRSMSVEEAEKIKRENISLCTMEHFRKKTFPINSALDRLPERVFITLDVDCFDWSVIRSTGTPEPGGFLWDEALTLLENIFLKKSVVAFDIVELSYSPTDPNSPFAAAKLIYKMLGFKYRTEFEK